jgi:hypothetical protein
MIAQGDIFPYLEEMSSLSRQFPYDKIGKMLSEMVPLIFKSPEYSALAKTKFNQTYVIPDEDIKSFPPFWNKKNTPNLCTRKMAQIESIEYIKKNPTIYISCDGGLYSPSNFTNDISMMRLSAVIQTPLLQDQVINVKSSTMLPDSSGLMDGSTQMTKGEFRIMYCMINQLTGGAPNCQELGCPGKDCPLKKINFDNYIKLIQEHNCKIIGFLDRPVCANYLRAFGPQYKKIQEPVALYYKLLQKAKEKKIPLISVKQSSSHRALTSTIIDLLAGRIHTSNSYMMEPILRFLEENHQYFHLEKLDPTIRDKYDLNNPEDFIRFLNFYWNNSILQKVLIDYSIFKHMVTTFEYRSNSYILHDRFLKQDFPDIDFHFFYVNYNNDWGRVEYVNATPEEAATHYYLQTAIGRYYPLIIKVAHERAVISSMYQEALKRTLTKYNLSQPTLKSLNKEFK